MLGEEYRRFVQLHVRHGQRHAVADQGQQLCLGAETGGGGRVLGELEDQIASLDGVAVPATGMEDHFRAGEIGANRGDRGGIVGSDLGHTTGVSSGSPAKCASRLATTNSPILRAGPVRGAALVRGEDDIIEGEERGGNLRLLLEDIERGAAELVGLQQLDERCFVDEGAAGDIDEIAFRAERLEHFAGDDPFGAPCRRGR